VRFASLGSGSEGNGLVVESGGTRILIDCGFGVRDTRKRLARLGLAPSSLDAILVTHEHADHIGGVPGFAAKYDIPVWATFGTLAVVSERFEGMERIYGFDSHERFAIGALEIQPVTVPHDAREPVQYVIGDGAHRVGVLTDIGMSTAHVESCLSGCDALVLECNHDLSMLARGDYPFSLKQRIASRFGHLHNEAAAEILGGSTRRASFTSLPRTSRERTTRRSSRAWRWRRRSTASPPGSAWRASSPDSIGVRCESQVRERQHGN
jgi:phosphoribosyl 1,2-cyclic phosphodiesterase